MGARCGLRRWGVGRRHALPRGGGRGRAPGVRRGAGGKGVPHDAADRRQAVLPDGCEGGGQGDSPDQAGGNGAGRGEPRYDKGHAHRGRRQGAGLRDHRQGPGQGDAASGVQPLHPREPRCAERPVHERAHEAEPCDSGGGDTPERADERLPRGDGEGRRGRDVVAQRDGERPAGVAGQGAQGDTIPLRPAGAHRAPQRGGGHDSRAAAGDGHRDTLQRGDSAASGRAGEAGGAHKRAGQRHGEGRRGLRARRVRDRRRHSGHQRPAPAHEPDDDGGQAGAGRGDGAQAEDADTHSGGRGGADAREQGCGAAHAQGQGLLRPPHGRGCGGGWQPRRRGGRGRDGASRGGGSPRPARDGWRRGALRAILRRGVRASDGRSQARDRRGHDAPLPARPRPRLGRGTARGR